MVKGLRLGLGPARRAARPTQTLTLTLTLSRSRSRTLTMTLSPSLALPTGKGVAGHESGRRLRPHRVWACGGGGRPGKPRPGLRRCVRRKRYCSCSRAAAVADRGKSEARNEGQAHNLDSEHQFPYPASAEPAHSTTRCRAAASTCCATTARQLALPVAIESQHKRVRLGCWM